MEKRKSKRGRRKPGAKKKVTRKAVRDGGLISLPSPFPSLSPLASAMRWGAQANGLRVFTPERLKSSTLRVTTVSLW